MTRITDPVLAAALILAGIAAMMYAVQRRVVFPRPTEYPRPDPSAVETVQLARGGAFFLPPRPSSWPAPLLLFSHGNGETASLWFDQFEEPRRRGWAVLLVEYPGYGGTAGTPSEESVVGATVAAFDWAARDPRIDPSRIVAYGRSLGSGAATRLAAIRPVAGLVIESGFTSIRPLAARWLVPAFLVRDPFDNLGALARYRGPMLVLHGTRDEVIPVHHGRALAAAVPGATFVPLECGHNDCPRPWPVLFGWLTEHGLARP